MVRGLTSSSTISPVSCSPESTSLDGGSVGDGLVGVDASAWLLAVEELLHQALHLGDPCGATHQHNLVNLLLGQIGILEHLLHWLESSPEEIHVELLELGPGQSLREVLALEQGLNLHANLVSSRKRPLGLFDLPPQLLHSSHVLPQVLALLLLVQLDEVVHNPLVEVFTSEMSVSVGCDDLKDTVVDGEEGDIKGSATKIEHKDVLLAFLLVHTISDGGGSGLVDDPHHVQASDSSGVLGGLPLSIVEVGRHGDDCVGNLLAKERLGGLLHLGQHHSRDLLSCKGLLSLASLDLDMRLGVLLNKLEGEELDVSLDGLVGELTSDETFGVEDCVLGVGGQLVLGGVTD